MEAKTIVQKNKCDDGELGIGRRIWNTLDTPIGQLFRARKRNNRQAELPQSVPDQTLAKERLFEPLIRDGKTGVSKQQERYKEISKKVSFSDCIMAAAKWAWRAGPGKVLTRAAGSVSGALIPYAISIGGAKTVDALVGISGDPNAEKTALMWFGVSAGLSLIHQGSNLYQSWVRAKHDTQSRLEMLRDIRKGLVKFTPEDQLKPEVGQMVTRTLQSQWAMQSFGQGVFDTIVPIATAAGACGIVATYDPFVAVALGLFALPYIYHAAKEGEDRLKAENDIIEALNRLGAREWGMMSGDAHLDLKLLQKVPELIDHVAEEVDKKEKRLLQPELNSIGRAAWLQPLNTLAISAIGLKILADAIATAKGIPTAQVSIGDYGMYLGALYSLNGSVRQFADAVGRLIKNLPLVKLSHGILKEASGRSNVALELSPESARVWDHAPLVEVNDLHFHYPATDNKDPKEVLRGVTFRAKPGELLGIVGSSGSGKSTLVKLLTKIYSSQPGGIKFDGQCLADIQACELWRNSAHMRQQGGNLFSMTIRENIKLGARANISDDEIMQAAERVGFKEVMDEDKLTLDTVLGEWFEGGKNLSGGQHTMLALTRIQVAGGKFLVLDEPTAALDQRRVGRVLSQLRALEDVTRIVIAHDFGIARNADRILVMNNGEIEDIGTHDELLERCETYQDGYFEQFDRLAGKKSREKGSNSQ